MASRGVSKKPLRHSWTIGAAYLLSSHATTVNVALDSGSQRVTRQLRHHALPTASYTLSLRASQPVGVYLRGRFGHTTSPSDVGKAFYAVGAGARITLGAP